MRRPASCPAPSLAAWNGDASSGSQSFTYDALDRPTGSSGLAAGVQSFTYDHDGNRLTKTASGHTDTATYERSGQQATLARKSQSIASVVSI